MEMKLFDPKFVHFMWDDSLNGKEGFFADDIETLIYKVNNNDIGNKGSVFHNNDASYQFNNTYKHKTICFRFFYYDPNYEYKIAYAKGEQIQFLSSHLKNDGTWVDAWYDCVPSSDGELKWNPDTKYRIKSAEDILMSYRQLAEWLAKGNGQCRKNIIKKYDVAYTYLICDITRDSQECDSYKIRRWGSDEWVKPTLDIYNEDCNNGLNFKR